MGFYVRKSLKAGPFRFNLSKSGVGVSAGVPGFRVGTGPRGNYVHVGRNGVYYRASLGARASGAAASRRVALPAPVWSPEMSANQQVAMSDITGATALELMPTSADDLVSQLNEAAAARAWWPVLMLIPILGWAVAFWLRLKQRARRSVVVFYEVDDASGQWFEQLVEAWGVLSHAAGLWRMTSQGSLSSTYQRKVNAMASTLVKRVSVTVSRQGPAVLVTNIAVPSVHAGRQSLHFLPDRVLVRAGRRFSEVSYAPLTVHCAQTRFIEAGRVPRDAVRVGTTWKYANVGGGPDRRYKNNRQLPILGYAELELATSSGLRWTLQCSNLTAAKAAATVLSHAKAPTLAKGPPPPAPEQLLSDAERDRASERLRTAYLDGRLTQSEYEERSGVALRARRQSELDACLEGIPAAPVPPPGGVSTRPAPASHAPQVSHSVARTESPHRPTPGHVRASAPLLKHPSVLWFSALPFGLGFWAPLYAGLRTKQQTVLMLGLAATAAFIGGCIALSAAGSHSTGTAAGIGTALWLASWAVAVTGAFIAWNDHKDRRGGDHHLPSRIPASSSVGAAEPRDVAGADDPPPPPQCAPRTRADQAALLQAKPVAWEYYLFASELSLEMAALDAAWRAHERGVGAGEQRLMTANEGRAFLSETFDGLAETLGSADRVFDPAAQERAFGRPGEAGNADRIRELAQRAVAIYAELLRVSALFRNQLVPAQLAAPYELAARITDKPIRQLGDFFHQTIQSVDEVGPQLANKEDHRPIAIELTLDLSIDQELLARLKSALSPR